MGTKPYNLFLDDSGTKEYADSYTRNGGVSRYFVFGGMLVTPAIAGYLTRRMHEIKTQCFGHPDVEIKANWLRIPHEKAQRYLEPFGIADEQLGLFVKDLYMLVKDAECVLFACAVDKPEMQSKYTPPWYAPAVAYECLLQRMQMEMDKEKGLCHVKIDDMSGATPYRRQYKDNLIKQHELLKANGSQLQKGMAFDRIGNLSFSDSKSDERIQLADLVAYNVYRQFVDHGEDWEADVEKLPLYQYLAVWGKKFCHSPSGQVAGYGIIKFPTVNRKYWSIPKKSP